MQTPNHTPYVVPSTAQTYYPVTQAPQHPYAALPQSYTQQSYQAPVFTNQSYDAKYQQTAQGQIVYPPVSVPLSNIQTSFPLAAQNPPAPLATPVTSQLAPDTLPAPVSLEKQITSVNLHPASKFVCYVIPFPNLKVAVAPGRFIPCFMVYTQLAPPTPTPAPGEKEGRLAKSKRKWEKSLADAKVKGGLKSKAILVCWLVCWSVVCLLVVNSLGVHVFFIDTSKTLIHLMDIQSCTR